MMTVEQMKAQKRRLGYTYASLAEAAGLPIGTVQKVLSGISRNPRIDTLAKLEAVLIDVRVPVEEQPLHKEGQDISSSDHANYDRWWAANAYRNKLFYGNTEMQEAVAEDTIGGAERVMHRLTIADYEALPPERRVELIDGVFYDMSSPRIMHQMIIKEILTALSRHIAEKGGDCIVLDSPTDVQLDCDDYTMVQPDILVVCDRSKITNKCIVGAPDMIVEVLSPSTRRKDSYLKLNKYMDAGVRSYWIVDPDRGRVFVYEPDSAELVQVYSFTESVPVSIWGNACSIDFAVIESRISFLRDID